MVVVLAPGDAPGTLDQNKLFIEPPHIRGSVGRAHEAIVLLQKSLERNPTHGSAQLFLLAALSLTGRHCEAASMADSFRQQYLEAPASAFEQFWLSRSASPVYRAQVYRLFDTIRALSAA